jgi:hypothetical protein
VAVVVASLVLLVSATVATGVATSTRQQAPGQVDREIITVDRGNTAELTVSAPEGGAVDFVIEADQSETNYFALVSVIDGNSDGQVTVQLDTLFMPGDNRRAYTTNEGDIIAEAVQFPSARGEAIAPGSYRIRTYTANEQRDSALIRVQPGAFANGSIEAVRNPAAAEVATAPAGQSMTTVASGDWAAVRVSADGLARQFERGSKAGTGLAYAAPALPDAESTHTVRVPINTTTLLQSISVRYDGDAPAGLDRLSVDRIGKLGVDTDADGVVDVELTDDIKTISGSEDGSVQVDLNSSYDVQAGSSVILQHQVTNPSTTGDARVRVGINGIETATGSITYGVAGSGVLGYGVDLTIRSVGSAETVPMVFPYHIQSSFNESTGTGVVYIPTTGLEPGRLYQASLSLTAASPLAEMNNNRTIDTRFRVVDRSVTIDQITLSRSRASVAGRTTLAPGSVLTVEASKTSGEVLFANLEIARPDGNRTWTAEVPLPDVPPGTNVTIRVYNDDEVLVRTTATVS